MSSAQILQYFIVTYFDYNKLSLIILFDCGEDGKKLWHAVVFDTVLCVFLLFSFLSLSTMNISRARRWCRCLWLCMFSYTQSMKREERERERQTLKPIFHICIKHRLWRCHHIKMSHKIFFWLIIIIVKRQEKRSLFW